MWHNQLGYARTLGLSIVCVQAERCMSDPPISFSLFGTNLETLFTSDLLRQMLRLFVILDANETLTLATFPRKRFHMKMPRLLTFYPPKLFAIIALLSAVTAPAFASECFRMRAHFVVRKKVRACNPQELARVRNIFI